MLLKTTIDAALPRAAPFILWDDELGGFGCKVHPTGLRTFIVRYRLRGARRLYEVALGKYGLLTVAQARKEARVILAEAAKEGGDPRAARKARAAAESALTATALVARYTAALDAGQASTTRLRGREAAPAYVEDSKLQLGRFATMHGTLAANAVTRADLLLLLDRYSKQPSVHRRLHGAIRRMYTWARARGLVSNNPTDDIETGREPSRERVLSLAELARIWRAADELEPVYGAAVHLLIVTGQRRAEVAGMVWGEIDLVRGLWTLPATRTKARRSHVLPLAPLAVAALQTRRASFKTQLPEPNDLVLPSLSRDGRSIAPISGWNWLKRELDRRSDVRDWRLHDFRRSLVTICAEHCADVAVLDSMLNHASSATRGGVIGVYQRATLLEPMREVIQLWDRLLREALGPAGAETSQNVILLAQVHA
jgi:integrase